ncbi:hypothetical protein ILUMI_07362 [Ignelater luminosus]|uniref:Uncharacterized protein n=1 Tax=Ignelater luminosus TaxID=2038154 RepID=A0A8K0GGE4_IGNLU|nr:hypothetical protein ILUMI_07362 [Ignelater luminosus]
MSECFICGESVADGLCAKGCHGGCSCRKNDMKCTTICKGQSYTNVQTEILILNPDDCNIVYDDTLEEGRRDFDDHLSNEEIEELEFMILRPSSAKRVKNLLRVSERN